MFRFQVSNVPLKAMYPYLKIMSDVIKIVGSNSMLCMSFMCWMLTTVYASGKFNAVGGLWSSPLAWWHEPEGRWSLPSVGGWMSLFFYKITSVMKSQCAIVMSFVQIESYWSVLRQLFSIDVCPAWCNVSISIAAKGFSFYNRVPELSCRWGPEFYLLTLFNLCSRKEDC